MKPLSLVSISLLLLTLTTPMLSQETQSQDLPLSLQAESRDNQWWKDRHAAKLKVRDEMENIDVLFIGDSITHSWETRGKEVFDEYFSDWDIFNIGYSGDRTEHVIWRLQNGEVDGISPKVAVMMIGTNNTGHRKDKPEDTAAGIKKILEELGERLPDTKILLLGIFPRDANPDGAGRKLNDATNELIKDYADEERIWFLNINDQFLNDDGHLPESIMPDRLHPNAEGYKIWAEAMKDQIAELAK